MDKKTLRGIFIKQRMQIPFAEAASAGRQMADILFAESFWKEARSVFCFIGVKGEPDTSPIIDRALSEGKTLCVPRTAPGGRMEAVPVPFSPDAHFSPNVPDIPDIPVSSDAPFSSNVPDIPDIPVSSDAPFSSNGTGSGADRLFEDWPLSFGIPEPPASWPAAQPASLDLAIVPSLSVDRWGYRLGYGGGYYDNFIAMFQTLQDACPAQKRPLFAAIQFASLIQNDPLPREKHDMKVDLIITETGIIIPV